MSSRPAQHTRLPSTSLGPSQPAMHSGGSSQPAGRSSGPTRTAGLYLGNNQQTPQALASAQPAGRSTASAPTSTQRISVSNQGSPRAQSPSTPPDPNQAGSKAPRKPRDEDSKNNRQDQKAQATDVAGSSSVPEPERLAPVTLSPLWSTYPSPPWRLSANGWVTSCAAQDTAGSYNTWRTRAMPGHLPTGATGAP